MPVEQSGSNATAQIQGNFNDVRGDQFNLVVHGNVTFSEHAHQRKKMENSLQDTIQLIQEIASLISIDTANTIMTDIATILSLLQKHTENEDSLSALTRSCKEICTILAFATKGVSMDRLGGAHWNALDALHLSIDNLLTQVRLALHPDGTVPASLAIQEIRRWTVNLEEISKLFHARLNIVSTIRLEQVYELLQQNDVPNLIPDPPPPPPTIFFGREELLHQLKAALVRDENIALTGPGGIGKSSLAMAVLNDGDIVFRYRRRFFVTYEGLSPKTITFGSFMDRIASVLGLSMLGVESERHIKMNLGFSTVLLVLDNAETFEDSLDRAEAMRISNFIVSITNTRRVAVILTSRTSSNARNISWTRFDVPPLSLESARLAFREIYHGHIGDEEIDKVLAAVDFHPLSISILSHTAQENRWSGKTIIDRWNSQQGKILQIGYGKDNLGFTIRLSLDSPSIQALGCNAGHVLWVVAFFPQGINQNQLTRLFPSVPRISSVVDTLCRLSLIYPSAQFLTMLAPIRLFLLDTLPTEGHEFLGDIRQLYYRSLEIISQDSRSDAALLISDHLNIEHLIVFDLIHPPLDIKIRNITSACRQFLRSGLEWQNLRSTLLAPTIPSLHTRNIASTCRQFLCGLQWHKPRPTLLAPTITSLPEETAIERDSKAQCLNALGDLYCELSNFSFASTASLVAHTLFLATGNHTMAARCASTTAVSYNSRGNFLLAQQLLESFISSSSWHHIDEESKAEIYFVLDASRMHSSNEGTDKLFLRSADDSWRGLESRVRHWQARMWHGYSTPDEVQKRLEPLRSECMLSSREWDRWTFLAAIAEAACMQRNFDAAMQLLDEAQGSVNGNFLLTMIILTSKAAVASVQEDYDLARSLLQYGFDSLGVAATSSSTDFLTMLYVQARNELYAGDYSTARQLFANVSVDCQDEIAIRMLCMRALGEVEMLLGRKSDSDRYFTQVVEISSDSGAPPSLLGMCTPMLKLGDDKFPGWKMFLAAHTG